MMGRPPRVPVDLQVVTRDVKARVRRVIGDLEAIEQQQDPIFASPRNVFLELVLSIHELEAVAAKMRKAWWPPPMKHCKHLGCRLAGERSCRCFGGKVVRHLCNSEMIQLPPRRV